MTSNAVEILRKQLGDSPERRERIEEEKARFSAACLIHDARSRAGLTQSQLAARIGTQQSVISRLESADYEGHTLTMLKRIADTLDLELNVSLDPRHPETSARTIHRRLVRATARVRRKGHRACSL